MRSTTGRVVLVLISAGVLVAALLAAASSNSDEIAVGQIYSTTAGDPIDALAGPGDHSGTICTNVSGFFYGSAASCFDADGARVTGSWELVIPTTPGEPPLVVGVVPAAAHSATVRIGDHEVRASMHGRWFLATLEPGALGTNNGAPVAVEFD
jgi:hypothetical protein